MDLGCFVFRADGNKEIGLGHVMRCLSIADAAVDLGQDVLFVLADDTAEQLVKKRGFPMIVLGSDYTDMNSELDRWPEKIEHYDDMGKIYIVVDSYYVTELYLKKLKQKRFGESQDVVLAYIDDLASFAYPVDFLINYELYADFAVYQALYKTRLPKMILGSEYAPLRKMFRNIDKRTQNERVKDVLISTGGSDFFHLVLKILSVLSSSESITNSVKTNDTQYLKYHFLIGKMNEDRQRIQKLAERLSCVELHEDVSDIKSLFFKMDVVVSAAGSTQFEVCACGVPMITYALADNQLFGMKALSKRGLAMSIGDLRTIENPVEAIMNAIDEMAVDYELRCEMGKRMQETIDGCGAKRCVKRIIELQTRVFGKG